MTYFTFETAWLVAHMQNSNNEALKQRLGAAQAERYQFPMPDEPPEYAPWREARRRARLNYENFETLCWAWQNGCLAVSGRWEDGVRLPPPVSCWPYRPEYPVDEREPGAPPNEARHWDRARGLQYTRSDWQDGRNDIWF